MDPHDAGRHPAVSLGLGCPTVAPCAYLLSYVSPQPLGPLPCMTPLFGVLALSYL